MRAQISTHRMSDWIDHTTPLLTIEAKDGGGPGWRERVKLALAVDEERERGLIVAMARAQKVATISSFWDAVKAWAFVTVYKAAPFISANVYCCQSAGDRDALLPIADGIVRSAKICTAEDLDKRHKPGDRQVAYEVTLLAPRAYWVPRRVETMSRARQRTYYVSLTRGDTGAGAGGFYLPSVWDEHGPTFKAETLVSHLARKAGGTGNEASESLSIYEVPCYVIGEGAVQVGRHDRGLFASVILERTRAFYKRHRRSDELAIGFVPTEVTKQHPTPAPPVYLTDTENVVGIRAASDVAAYWHLEPPEISRAVIANLLARDAKSVKYKLARTLLVLEIGRTDYENLRDDIETLLAATPFKEDTSFANPQIILALCNYANTLPIINAGLLTMIKIKAREFITNIGRAKEAFAEHRAFAANWHLQAAAAACRLLNVDLSSSVSFLDDAVKLCEAAVDNARLESSGVPVKGDATNTSLTEQVCAAHGLLAVDRFNYWRFDWLCEYWARLQWQWSSKNGSGGFRYWRDEPEYRTDVTSHVVAVCHLMLHR